MSQGFPVVYDRTTDRKGHCCWDKGPGVPVTPVHPGGFRKLYVSLSYVPFLLTKNVTEASEKVTKNHPAAKGGRPKGDVQTVAKKRQKRDKKERDKNDLSPFASPFMRHIAKVTKTEKWSNSFCRPPLRHPDVGMTRTQTQTQQHHGSKGFLKSRQTRGTSTLKT